MENENDIQLQEQAFLKLERARVPEKFQPVPKTPDQLMRRIGITVIPSSLPRGFIKYSPLDFIVEEISANGQVIDVTDGGAPTSLPMEGIGTIYADVTKVGISTLDVVNRIAETLKIPPQKIGYAGIKDAGALTSQRISLRTVNLSDVQNLKLPSMLLKHIREGKGAIQVGDLQGNRFTLFVRTMEQIGREDFERNISELSQKGVLNFFGIQRFGSPRFISHLLGMTILQGDFATTVRLLLTGTSIYEWPYVTELRSQAAKVYGDWSAMDEVFKKLPYTFRFEREAIKKLAQRPGEAGYIDALSSMPQQITLWVRAYSSYLANILMSQAYDGKISIPEPLPLFFSMDRRAQELYASWAKEHETGDFFKKIKVFPFLHVSGTPEIPVFVDPKFQSFTVVPEGVALCFDLPKGSYATTVLSALFQVESGIPVPEWVKTKEYDTKELLGLGSIKEVRSIFGENINTIMQRKQAVAAEGATVEDIG